MSSYYRVFGFLTGCRSDEKNKVDSDDASSSCVSVVDEHRSEQRHITKYDIANLSLSAASDSEKMEFIDNLWVPDDTFKFPKTSDGHGQKNRSFRTSWLQNFKWLSYSRSENSAFCKYCRLFYTQAVGHGGHQESGRLVRLGYDKWKNALEDFRKHENLGYHKTATIKFDNFLSVMSGKKQSVELLVDTARARQIKENRENIVPIVETVILCARQGIALRGHRDHGPLNVEHEPEENEGNFKAILRTRISAGDVALKKHFDTCSSNASYTSWKIQNEILHACSKIVVNKIATEVNTTKCFALLGDETADISNTEQLAVCVRYVKEGQPSVVCEHFLCFTPIHDLTGEGIAAALISTLETCNIDKHMMRGQGYDGAASMSGAIKGTQSYIQAQVPEAIYVHCAAHCLNLAISDTCTHQSIRNCLGTVEKIYSFFNTPKRQHVLQDMLKTSTENIAHSKLLQVCPTRWVQRHDAIMVLCEMLEIVLKSLEEIEKWKDKEASSGAFLLRSAVLQPQFLISLYTLEAILSYSLPLSKILQSTSIDIFTAMQAAENAVLAVKEIRNSVEAEFKKVFDRVSHKWEITVEMPRISSKQKNRDNTPATNPEEYYRRTLFIPFCEHFINHLEERFISHKKLLTSFACLVPTGNAPTSQEISQLLQLSEFYKTDFQDKNEGVLTAELRLWYIKFSNNGSDVQSSAIGLLNDCNKDIYPNIYIALKIFATLPVSTATPERSFSTLRRLKTYLRSTMGQDRLTDLATVNIHREIKLNPEEVIDMLQKTGRRRLDFVL